MIEFISFIFGSISNIFGILDEVYLIGELSILKFTIITFLIIFFINVLRGGK